MIPALAIMEYEWNVPGYSYSGIPPMRLRMDNSYGNVC